jgi:hypothetical protein
MIEVLAQTLEAGDEANARHLFDVFETLLILVRTRSIPTLFVPNTSVGNTSSESAHPSTGPVLHSS